MQKNVTKKCAGGRRLKEEGSEQQTQIRRDYEKETRVELVEEKKEEK